jgi:hypothetical protein
MTAEDFKLLSNDIAVPQPRMWRGWRIKKKGDLHVASTDGGDRSPEKDNPDTGTVTYAGYSTSGLVPYPIRSSYPTAREDASESTSLETNYQTEPIRCWRGLSVVADGNNVALGSVNEHFGKFPAVKHQARCNAQYLMDLDIYGRPRGSQHPAPDNDCSCGFYGVMDRKDVMTDGPFIAEVEFFGKVVEHEIGYRAEYQRVLSVRVVRPEWCMGKFLCPGKPEVVWFNNEVPPVPPGRMVFPSLWGSFAKATFPPAVICTECASGRERWATLPMLAARLGVEVRWDG